MSNTPIKVLHRTRLGRPTSIPLSRQYRPPIGQIIRDTRESVESVFATRKPADGLPLSFIDRIKEFIARNKPGFDVSGIAGTLSKIKAPLIAVIGIAFVGGLAYLAHRLYKHFTDKNKNETINKIMKDLEDTSPDLLTIPGWRDTIRNEVISAVNSGKDSDMVEKIAKIKEKIIEHQQSINPQNLGNGINLFI